MTSRLAAVAFDANDPRRVATFWAGVLGWEMTDEPDDGFALLPNDDTGFRIEFFPSEEQKRGPNQMHFDLTSNLEGQQEIVDRAVGLGARHIDIGQRPEEGHVVLADPEGNEFCVIAPGNDFLAACGFLGAIASEGTQQVGYFWAEALGWPLVWAKTRRPRSVHLTAARRSRGAARPSTRSSARTGCTSTSLRRRTRTSRRRLSGLSPSVRSGSTSGRGTSAGW